MLGHWHNLEIPTFSTLSAWSVIVVITLAAIAISFWIANFVERR